MDGAAAVGEAGAAETVGVLAEGDAAPNGCWGRHLAYIKPPASIPADEVSDFWPWVPRDHPLIRAVEMWSLFVIVVSVVAFCVETLPKYRMEWEMVNATTGEQVEVERDGDHSFFFALESACVGWFTIEYLWRLYFAMNIRAFLTDGLNIVDIVAILPYYIALMLADGGSSISIVRILRLSRVSRVAKVSRHSSSLQDLVTCIKKTKSELALFFLMTGVATVLFASMAFYAEKEEPNTPFISIPASMWWAICTMTTVGYGDMSPTTVGGKIVGALCATIGVIILAIPAGIFISEFIQLHEERKRSAAREASDESAKSMLSKVEMSLADAFDALSKVKGSELLRKYAAADEEVMPDSTVADNLTYTVIRAARAFSRKDKSKKEGKEQSVGTQPGK